jgi:hypothetical protein
VAGTANPDSDALGRPGGHIWFAVVAVALVALGVLLDERRDA